MKILWLTSWYPSELDLFNGDFIQRHAEAASLYNDIEVVYVIKDEIGKITKNFKIVENKKGRLTEKIIYYFACFQVIPFIGKIFSDFKYRRLYKNEIIKYINKNGKPQIVHVHVCLKAGILALWLKKKFDLPYIVTEHSSIFLCESEKRLEDLPNYFQRICLRVLKHASSISVVSNHLGKSMQRFLKVNDFTVIPNVVNTKIFKPALKSKNKDARFIHISSLNYAKNAEAILQAFCIVKNSGKNFVVDFFGPNSKTLIETTKYLGLTNYINFHQEVPHKVLVRFIQQSDFLILYSRYETFGCVVIEANACGVPVIVSDIPALKERVKNNFNGLLVNKDNAISLAEIIIKVIEGKFQFNSQLIADFTMEQYSYEKIGSLFHIWYNEQLG
jgi:glycosyltransferase involved in cell wall biosynthesis